MKERFIFNQNGKKAYMPFMCCLKNYVFRVFSVPGKNRVGTIELDNGFTLIEFNDDELDYDLIAKDYEKEVYGDYKFSFAPVYADDEIIYGQNSRFHHLSIKDRHLRTYDLFGNIIKEMGDYFYRIQYAGKRNVFLCEEQISNYENELKIIKVIEFSDKTKELGSLPAGTKTISYDQPWQFNNGIIFTYDSSANKLICHTTELKQTTHPFAEIFNRNSGKFRKLKEFLIHPTLPFGIVFEIGKDLDWNKLNLLPPTIENDKLIDSLDAVRRIHALYLLRWDTPDTNKQFVPIFTEPVSVIPGLHPKTYSDFQFSPDGKWLVFRDETQYSEWQDGTPTAEQSPVFVALPINDNNPLYFGEPLYLGKVPRENAVPQSSAWVQKPVSFVVSDGLVLYKWELETINTAMLVNTPNDVVHIR